MSFRGSTGEGCRTVVAKHHAGGNEALSMGASGTCLPSALWRMDAGWEVTASRFRRPSRRQGRKRSGARASDQIVMAKKAELDVDGRKLAVSNLDKVLYPEVGFTKAHVIDYYIRIAPVLLPHLKNR